MITTETVITVAAPSVRGIIHGPTPKGSMKCVGRVGQVPHQLVEDPRRGQVQWRKAIVAACRPLGLRADDHQPIGVDVTFTVPRPASHYGTGRNRNRLKPDAPILPTGHMTNDTDKMFRLLADALQDAQVIVDDAQIVALTARKAYPGCVHTPRALDWPGAVIQVAPVQVAANLDILIS